MREFPQTSCHLINRAESPASTFVLAASRDLWEVKIVPPWRPQFCGWVLLGAATSRGSGQSNGSCDGSWMWKRYARKQFVAASHNAGKAGSFGGPEQAPFGARTCPASYPHSITFNLKNRVAEGGKISSMVRRAEPPLEGSRGGGSLPLESEVPLIFCARNTDAGKRRNFTTKRSENQPIFGCMFSGIGCFVLGTGRRGRAPEGKRACPILAMMGPGLGLLHARLSICASDE